MVIGDDGKVLAHEMALTYDESDGAGEGFSLVYYAPSAGLIFYLRTSRVPEVEEISARVEAIVEKPSHSISR
jgi:hypothetical protein